MTDIIAALDELHAKTTPGPLDEDLEGGRFVTAGNPCDHATKSIAEFFDIDDMLFFIAAHNAWPAVSAEIKRLREENEKFSPIIPASSPHGDADKELPDRVLAAKSRPAAGG